MKKPVKLPLPLFLILALILSSGGFSLAADQGITHLYTFGDSSIDIGRAKELTKSIVEADNPPEGAYIKAEDGYYFEGRYSNGRVYTELLAEALGVKLTNYAVGGAKSGPDASGYTNWSSWLPNTGGIEQTKEFVESRGGKVDPKALYLISIGGNDTYNLKDDTVDNVAAQSVANIQTMVQDLAQAGAKKFVVMLLSGKPNQPLSAFTQTHQALTIQSMQEAAQTYNVEIQCIDLTPLVRDIEKNMEAYGYKTFSYYLISDYIPAIGYSYHFLDNTERFQDAPAGYTSYTYDGFLGYDQEGFWTPDEYYYYDEYHVTRTTHKNIFNYVYPLIHEPPVVAQPGAVEGFLDVEPEDWYYDAVATVAGRGLIPGVSDNLFAPQEFLQRGDLILSLAKLNQADLQGYRVSPFSDVNMDEPAGPAIAWAVAQGLIQGTEPETFSPAEPLTQEQLVVLLIRYAQTFGEPLRLSTPERSIDPEAEQVSPWAVQAVITANQAGFISGDTEGRFHPQDHLTRAQAASVLMRYADHVTMEKAKTETPAA